LGAVDVEVEFLDAGRRRFGLELELFRNVGLWFKSLMNKGSLVYREMSQASTTASVAVVVMSLARRIASD